MPLRSILRRARVSALAVGLATAGVLALSTAATAATANITVTLRITVTSANSDCVMVGMISADSTVQHSRNRGFTVGETRDIVLTVPAPQRLQVYPSRHCYSPNGVILGVPVQHDGEVIPLTL